MGLFSFFNKKNDQITMVKSDDNPIDKELFVQESDDQEDVTSNIVIQHNSTLIDGIFEFLSHDFESRGYGDAIVQPDTHYLNENLDLLKKDYQLKIDRARYKYKEFLTELEFHISTRDAMGLTEIVEGLKAKKTIVLEHLSFVNQELDDIQRDIGKVLRIKLSYTKGFKRGASALSNSFITSSRI